MEVLGVFGVFAWVALCFFIGSVGSKRKIGWAGAFFISLLLSPLIGLIVVAFSDKNSATKHKWKEYAESAKKSEFKGEISDAISNYMDAIYHLENDYKNLSQKSEETRSERLADLRMKVEELRTVAEAKK